MVSRAAIVLLAVAACGGDAPRPAAASAAAGRGAPTPAPRVESPGRAVVLLEPGAEPRTLLRYALPASGREKLAMTMTGASKVQGGEDVWSPKQPIHVEMEVRVGEKPSDRELVYRFVVTAASIMRGAATNIEGPGARLTAELEGAVGIEGTAVVDDRGVIRALELNEPPELEPTVHRVIEGARLAMEQMSSPLPEEPVGIGARWELERAIEPKNGFRLKQKVMFELVGLKGRRAQLRSTIQETADPPGAIVPYIDGARVELLSHAGSGTGTIQLDLTRLIPLESTATVKTETSIKFSGGDWDGSKTMSAENTVDMNGD